MIGLPTLVTAARALDLAKQIIEGKITDVPHFAREVAAFALDLVPVEEMKGHLDAEAAARAEAVADAAEEAKLAITGR